MILFLLIFIALNLQTCSSKPGNLVVTYYKNGEAESISKNDFDESKILNLIEEIFKGSNEVLKIYMGEERINELIKNEEGIEIVFDSVKKLNSESLGSYEVKRIYFPLTGDFIGNKNDPVITIITGNPEFETGPLRNTKGFSLLQELKREILENNE